LLGQKLSVFFGLENIQIKNLFCWLFLKFCLSACASLAMVVPNPSVSNPELPGGEPGDLLISLGNYSAHEYEVSPDASRRPPDLNNPKAERALGVFAGLGSHLHRDILVTGAVDPVNTAVILKGQWQLSGAKQQSSKQGDWSTSLNTQASYGRANNSGDQSSQFGPGGHPWEGVVSATTLSFGASVGYRLVDKALFYVGASHGWNQLQSRIHHQQNTDGSSPGASYTTDDNGTATTLGVGIQLGRSFQVSIKYEHTILNYQALPLNPQIDQIVIGLGF
jgi:opacity protein-like surface antigen